MSHYSNVARPDGIIVHHTTDHSSSDTNWTAEPCPGYDYMIIDLGGWYSGSRRYESPGCHAKGCNCNRTGIGLQGCFGSSDSTCDGKGNLLPTSQQRCALAYLWHHIGAPKFNSRLRPHINCFYWNPCSGSPEPKDCCGTRLIKFSSSDFSWGGSHGIAFRDEIRQRALNYANCGACNC